MRGRKPRMPFRCERDDADDVCARSALADLVRDVRLIGHERAGDGPSASMADAQAATSRDEEVACRAYLCWFPGPSVVRFGAADSVEPQSSASRVVCRCPEWPQAVSGVLKSAATLTNRSGEGASRCALRATSSKHGPRGPEAVVGSGDESPFEMNRTYADPVCLSIGHAGAGACRLQPTTCSSARTRVTVAKPCQHIQDCRIGIGCPAPDLLDRVLSLDCSACHMIVAV